MTLKTFERLRRRLGLSEREADGADLPADYRHNFACLATDHASFSTSFTFFSPSAVLPALLGILNASAPLIGFTGTVFGAGMHIPQLAFARLLTGKARKKPYMLAGASVRVLLPLISVALWSGITRRPEVAIVFLLSCFTVFALMDGLCNLSWLDIMARAIPVNRRGRLVAISHVASSVAGVGVGGVLTLILSSPRLQFPDNYALIFTLATVAVVPSVIALLSVREPPSDDSPSSGRRSFRRGWVRALLSDRTLVHLIVARVLINLVGLATPFYVGHARDVLGLPTGIVGAFVTAETIGSILAIVLLSPLAERRGPQVVIRVVSAIGIVAPLLALVLHLAGGGWLSGAYPIVYAAYGAVRSVWLLGFANYAIEIAPPDMRPAYIGLSNSIMGAMALAPALGGWLLQATSYTVLFGSTAVIVAAGFVVSLSLPSTRKVPS
jgi:Na+/melibiose symporter-like transporter